MNSKGFIQMTLSEWRGIQSSGLVSSCAKYQWKNQAFSFAYSAWEQQIYWNIVGFILSFWFIRISKLCTLSQNLKSELHQDLKCSEVHNFLSKNLQKVSTHLIFNALRYKADVKMVWCERQTTALCLHSVWCCRVVVWCYLIIQTVTI